MGTGFKSPLSEQIEAFGRRFVERWREVSGGSYNNVWATLAHDNDMLQGIEDARRVADALESEGYPTIAGDLRALLEWMERVDEEFNQRVVPLSRVMKALEYYYSLDWKKEQFEKVAREYLKQKKKAEE